MSNNPQSTKATLGLTGLTMNAMALIAPGAFLWLTFQMQSTYGSPMAGCAMWAGIVLALLLCLATAISYAELSKLYPGAGSSYFYAEQAYLSKTKHYKFARIAKFFTGWASHLYYWVYPGLMVGVTAILAGWLLNQFWPETFSGTYNSPLFMFLFCPVFALGVAYIAYRGVNGSTGVSIAINVIQITALLIFTVIAIAYRANHPQGVPGFHLSNGNPVNYVVAQEPAKDADGKPLAVKDADGKDTVDKDGKPVYTMVDSADKDGTPVPADKDGKPLLNKDGKADVDSKDAAPFAVSYAPEDALTKDDKGTSTFNFHSNASSVLLPHGFSYMFIQACIAILILVGFESVTAMGEEAKDAKRDIPHAAPLLSLLIQGAFCYLLEYFAANYLLHNGYTIGMASSSGAPIGDLMLITGTWLFGSASAGKAFMLVQAATVFLALIGTTLSCLNTGARVTYAMGRDEEVPSHFGLLHGKTLSPHRSIWTLAVISAIIGIVTCILYMGEANSAPAPLDPKYHNFWYSFGIFSPDAYPKLPSTLLIITLVSNFGTFMLYMMTCWIAIVAFKDHHLFSGFKHFFIPIFGLVANLACMLFYLVGPFIVAGMSWKEPFIALGVSFLWGVYGIFYFVSSSKKKDKPIYVEKPLAAAA